MDRTLLIEWWTRAWDEGLWAASWNASVQGLTPEQAAWKPAPERHSIWRIVSHVVFWREHELGRAAGRARASDAEIAAKNFPEPEEVSEGAWRRLLERLGETQERIATVFRDPAADASRLAYVLPHDCYHFGQINYVRALQGLEPID